MSTLYRRPHGLRITGPLVDDAQLVHTTGPEPHALLMLTVQAPKGLPYAARIDIGPDVVEHMRAEALLPRLRRHALVSVAAHGCLPQRTDHGHAVIPLIDAHGLVVRLDA